MHTCLATISNLKMRKFFSEEDNARRVLWWYNLVASKPPLIVLYAPERGKLPTDGSDIVAVVRTLSEDWGLRVLVDSSPNSLPGELLARIPSTVFTLTPMPSKILKLEFAKLHEALEQWGLDKLAWEVLGGYPAHYVELNKQIYGKCEPTEAILAYLAKVLATAQDTLDKYELQGGKALILEMQRSKSLVVPRSSIEFRHPDPDKAFCLLRESRLYVPATPAIAFVLRHNIWQASAMEKLKELADLDRQA
eukprot:Colp12_sorted_trinity150504_noHs@1103